MVALFPTGIEAHGGQPLAPHDLQAWQVWVPEWAPLTIVLVTGWFYFRGVTAATYVWRQIAFLGALAILVVAVASPLHDGGEALLSAHMVQHLLLLVVVAPLAVLARPLPVLLRAAPASRNLARRIAVLRFFHLVGAFLLTLPVATFLHTVTVVGWHIPPAYEASLSSPLLHVIEHVTFLGSAVLFWAAVFRRGPGREVRVASLLALLAVATAGNAIGAILVFSDDVLYTQYSLTSPLWGIDGRTDQTIAGVVMWMFGGLFYVAAAIGVLVGALQDMERRQRRSSLLGEGTNLQA